MADADAQVAKLMAELEQARARETAAKQEHKRVEELKKKKKGTEHMSKTQFFLLDTNSILGTRRAKKAAYNEAVLACAALERKLEELTSKALSTHNDSDKPAQAAGSTTGTHQDSTPLGGATVPVLSTVKNAPSSSQGSSVSMVKRPVDHALSSRLLALPNPLNSAMDQLSNAADVPCDLCSSTAVDPTHDSTKRNEPMVDPACTMGNMLSVSASAAPFAPDANAPSADAPDADASDADASNNLPQDVVQPQDSAIQEQVIVPAPKKKATRSHGKSIQPVHTNYDSPDEGQA
ncbi:hypothetical protein AX16_006280 [Volvariella volvacea WC 439]|nr:hypothetical protein AX16_006280 [Volvariella volvacea WC 439]